MNLHAFPKIWAIGQKNILELFMDDVEVTEKVDGSQFVFGNVEGDLQMRSKGKEQHVGAIDKMFVKAADYVTMLHQKDLLPLGTAYYCEYLDRPKHNTLAYDHVPLNNLYLFGMSKEDGSFISHHATLKREAARLAIDHASLLYYGPVDSVERLFDMLDTDSYLGNVKVEGVVVKNYHRDYMMGGMYIPIMCGKYVSEEFKERHNKGWGKEHTTRGKWEVYKQEFRTEARWQKAYQHLRDDGVLEGAPRDIGKLIKEIQRDIIEEEKQAIVDHLWAEFSPDLLRTAIAGAPEWYKEKLANRAFDLMKGQ
jgi:hypothetical protein